MLPGPILITSCLCRKDTRLSTRYIFAFQKSLGTRLIGRHNVPSLTSADKGKTHVTKSMGSDAKSFMHHHFLSSRGALSTKASAYGSAECTAEALASTIFLCQSHYQQSELHFNCHRPAHNTSTHHDS